MKSPATPTAADLELSAVHESRELVRGNDECGCRLCKHCRVYLDGVRCKAIWQIGGGL